MEDEFLLSICIPTYNRADILKETLLALTQNPDFDKRVEVVISDNCSTDHTEEVVTGFAKQFHNIKYSRNSRNIEDGNFFKVLSLGNGRYLKLVNDTAKFKAGMLRFVLDKIEEHSVNREKVFFYQNTFFCSNTHFRNEDINDFVRNASFLCTWIANFGIWKEELSQLEDVDRSIPLKLVQVDWSLQMASSYPSLIYFQDLFEVATLSKKGGYNIFKVFIENYLFLLSRYLKDKQLQHKVFRKEKYRLFNYFVLPWLCSIFLNKNKYFFDTQQAFQIIFKYYKYCPYIYFSPIMVLMKKMKKQISS